jgi:hypothetical protein
LNLKINLLNKKLIKLMKNHFKILLIIEIIFLAAQIFIYFDFQHQNNTRYDYSDLMKDVKKIIYQKQLDNKIEDKFTVVFNNNWGDEEKFSFFYVTYQIILGIFSIIGVILDFVFLSKNKKQYISIILFSFVLMVGVIDLVNTIYYENDTDLNLSDEELNAFNEIRESIDESLSLVRKRVILLRVYSTLIIFTSFYQLFSSVYYNRDIIPDYKKEILESSEEEKIINSPLENNLTNNKNESE